MMFQVPRFTLSNYADIMDAPWSAGSSSTWRDGWDLILALTSGLRDRFADVDARQLSQYLQQHPLPQPFKIGDTSLTLGEALIAMKLLFPSLWTSKYFFWQTGKETHGGIDIILPQHTPIHSFTGGKVVKIKHRDGHSANEGNYIVIQSPDGYCLVYEHLQSIGVNQGQNILQHEQIGTCGSTGNSTQFHLHLQIEKSSAPSHPYRNTQLDKIQRYTIDPIPYLQAKSPHCPFIDMPIQAEYLEAIRALYKMGIIQGHQGHVYPDSMLNRYEMALLIDRILVSYDLYDGLPIITPNYTAYSDVSINDPELHAALTRLQKYGIMKGHAQKFYPFNALKGEELLALLGRIFYGLSDAVSTPWYAPYVDALTNESIIEQSRPFVHHSIPRKEVFLTIHRCLRQQV